MDTSGTHLYRWQDCSEFSIQQTQKFYRDYVNATQAGLLANFAFGRTTISKAEGMYLYTSDGKKILDLTGGLGVLNHGHNHPRILEARIQFQKQNSPEVHKFYLSQYVAGLSHNIAQLLPEDLNVSYFCNSGAEAVEGAVKIAYKYHMGSRKVILHSDISYHGKLLGTGGLTASSEYHFQFPTIPFTEAYVYNDIHSIKEKVSQLRQDNGESDIYAIVLEPFSASTLRECSNDFLKTLRDICDQEKIILIFDEVYSGWGKTGELFYFMHHQVIPDVLTYSKSFGGGKSSISGFTARSTIFKKAYDNPRDFALHSTTYNGFGEECITAIEAINIVVEDDYASQARRIEKKLGDGLKELHSLYPDFIQDIRGRGAHFGIFLNDELPQAVKFALKLIPQEIFRDPQFPSKLVAGTVISELYTSEDILTMMSFHNEIFLMISPSLIATDEEIDIFLNALDKTLTQGRMNLLMKFAKSKFFH